METSSKLMVFEGDGDAFKLLQLYENMSVKGLPGSNEVVWIIAFLGRQEFDFYFDRTNSEAKTYLTVKDTMWQKSSTQKPKSKVMGEAISLI